MALREDGHVVGSVSGGCIEDDLMLRARKDESLSHPKVISYGVDADEARRFGLPCGGTMRLVQEPLNAGSGIEDLLSILGQGEIITRVLNLNTGKTTLRNAENGEVLSCDETQFSNVFGPRYRLLIIGAGQIGELLARIALTLDFAVTVCDPREEYHHEWSVDDVTLVRTMPDDTVVAMKADARMAVVALTHDPKLDDMALMEALASEAFYVAALGSLLNNDRRRERLLEFDLNETQIARLFGPAGLSIGSHTPAEIAVAIAAQLVAVKNGF
jgi:xanthine dehydrogenase accessory factor